MCCFMQSSTHGPLRLDDPAEFSHQVQSVQLVVPGFLGPPYQGFRSFTIFIISFFSSYLRDAYCPSVLVPLVWGSFGIIHHLHPGPKWSTWKYLVFLDPLTRALGLCLNSSLFEVHIAPYASTSCKGLPRDHNS